MIALPCFALCWLANSGFESHHSFFLTHLSWVCQYATPSKMTSLMQCVQWQHYNSLSTSQLMEEIGNMSARLQYKYWQKKQMIAMQVLQQRNVHVMF